MQCFLFWSLFWQCWHWQATQSFDVASGGLSPDLGSITDEHSWLTKRLPPQVAFAGKTTIVRLEEHFGGGQSLNYFHYCLDDREEMNGALIECPFWMDWDSTIPQLTVTPPKNLSAIQPAYSLRIVARPKSSHLHSAPVPVAFEEDLVLVVAHSCFKHCPHHFGIGCTDWELWMLLMGAFGVFMLAVGYCVRDCFDKLSTKGNIFAAKRQYRKLQRGLKGDLSTDSSSDDASEVEALRKEGVINIQSRHAQLRNFFDNSSDDEIELMSKPTRSSGRRKKKKAAELGCMQKVKSSILSCADCSTCDRCLKHVVRYRQKQEMAGRRLRKRRK